MKYPTLRSAALICTAAALLICGCAALPGPAEFHAAAAPVRTDALPELNPGEPGPYQVASFRYGSRHNPRRPEYAHAAVRTEPFDLSPFFDDLNEPFWGYDASQTPVNGIVWYPLGPGPFPVFLIVHGNHNPAAFSESGYDYLGELLASRGIVVVSVDQNMLNGNHRGENGARAILLLEHARTVLDMNANPGTPLAGRLDTTRVALAGHSRGGEAAALAAMLNHQPMYPGDGTVLLDYDVPVRGVISIAPVEGQYRPAGRELPVPPEVHYMVLHGSQDGDVDMHMGLRFFHRTGISLAHRLAVWVYGADHAAFNSSWARSRDPIPSSPRLLLPVAAQQDLSRVLVSAFLEQAFERDQRAHMLVESPHAAIDEGWLPATGYLTQYRRPGAVYLNTFEDDEFFATAALGNWTNSVDGAEAFRELRFGLRNDVEPEFSFFGHAGTWALEIGWEEDHNDAGEVVFRSETHTQAFAADAVALDLVVASWDSDEPFRAWLVAETVDGERSQVALHEEHLIRPAPEVHILRGRTRHFIPETIYIPLERFAGLAQSSEIRSLELRIPRSAAGSIIIPAVMLYGGGA